MAQLSSRTYDRKNAFRFCCVDVKVGETYSFRISPAWKDPAGEKLGWMRAFTINGKEYVLTEL